VNSTAGKALTMGEYGPNTPKRRAPLASGGRTNGTMTIVLKINFPGKFLNRAKKYDKGIPNTDRIKVETVAENTLSIKALVSCGRNIA
jgi:hypothetical protein